MKLKNTPASKRYVFMFLGSFTDKGKVDAKAEERGIPWSVVRPWKRKDGHFEQDLKQRYALKALCPGCSGPHAFKRGAK
jgi:hypothetical protein